jgi:hypothetical protein
MDCPDNSSRSNDGNCLCDNEYSGTITWNETESDYDGYCLSATEQEIVDSHTYSNEPSEALQQLIDMADSGECRLADNEYECDFIHIRTDIPCVWRNESCQQLDPFTNIKKTQKINIFPGFAYQDDFVYIQ